MNYPRALSASVAFALSTSLMAFAACGGSERRDYGEPAEDAYVVPDAPPAFPDAGPGPEEDARVICETAEFEAEPVPLTLVVLLDRSGSMDMGGTDRWTPATNAIRSFVDRSEVVGMEMGLQFFPSKNGSGNNVGDYASLAVPIDTLPENVLPIVNELARTTPNGGTPMAQGLTGTITALRSFVAANGPRAAGIVLVTDGEPNGGVNGVVSAAQAGANPMAGEARVRTFAVGMEGASFGTLNQIAAAGGGAPTAFNVGGGAAMQQALLEALDTIRTGAIGCEYVLPVPTVGTIDLETVEVLFTPGANDPVTAIRKVDDLASCGATTGGFYYDDAENATRVMLCPASCEAVSKGTADAQVELSVGCIVLPN